MLFYVIICLSGMLMALFVSFLLIYIVKFKEYMVIKKKDGNMWFDLMDIFWRISLPILFGLVTILVPIKTLCFFVTDVNLIKSLSSYYIYFFVPSFFIFMFILIKSGKIKTGKTLE